MSQLEIFPQTVQVYPNDQRLFELRSTYPPPMWKINTSQFGFVQPDFSVAKVNPNLNLDITAEGVYQLIRGLGTIEWTLDNQCVPTSDGDFSTLLLLQHPGSSAWIYRVRIKATNILVDYESGNNATLTITPVAGMRFKIEIVSGFRLYINDVLQHSRTSFSANVAYPAIYRAILSGTSQPVVTGPARIPAPKLIGDWQLSPVDNTGAAIPTFSVDHGSLANGANFLQQIYSGGTVPGQYILRGDINPGKFIWMFDSIPTGGTQVTSGGDAWTFVSSSPTPFSGGTSHKSSNISGDHSHGYTGTTATMQVNPGDKLYAYVFPDATNTPTEIMLEWTATDGSGSAHRAYWGANSLTQGTDGTASRRFMGSLPATGQWTRLEVPASLIDLEGRVVNGMNFRLFNGVCSFDENGKLPNIQHAEATISIPALQILGDLVRTMQPGQISVLQTNYDNSQTGPSLVTWSVVSGGGTISGNKFTASSAPGTTVLRASSTGNQVADLTINVPAVITPDFAYVGPSETIDWDTNIPSPTWSSVPSGINSSTGVWTSPSSIDQIIQIQATNGTFTVIRNIQVMDIFPLGDPILPVTWDHNLTALISMSEDRTNRVTREKAAPYDSYEIKFSARTLTESNTVDAFFDAHGFGKLFILQDNVRGIRKVGWFDSIIRHEGNDTCFIDLSFRFLEARLPG